MSKSRPYKFISMSAVFIIIVSLLTFILPVASCSNAPDSIRAGNLETLLQFTSAGHVLGFGQESVYVAGLDHALHVEFNNANHVQPVAGEPATAQSSPAPLDSVRYNNIWNNIDIIYNAADGGIAESTYIIRAGGNPADISLGYNVPAQIMPSGGLLFSFNNGYLTESAPIAWQEVGEERITVAVAFQNQPANKVGFNLGRFDSNYDVYIDPTYSWHTFYGSSDYDGGNAIAVDSSGNIYVTGYSESSWDGPGGVAPLHAFAGSGDDIPLVKLNSSGAYQWHTFYGCVGNDRAYGIDVDISGNVFLTGFSASAWNGSWRYNSSQSFRAI